MISKKEFTEKVEKLCRYGKSDVMSAILKVCEENMLEPESAKRLLSPPCLLYTSPSPRDVEEWGIAW